ncbi:MAG: prepilin-type N-terminal cleavage/methylation domain-containing protein [Planctomycetes bacterium]|nr:prepilin-type N-terminal cleavage/methylation domain-containing protein [Planctomycetota bacterium]MBU1518426.1 prepilin-type N-terminal cleavage/methylation domain-containing protein [Planctomycetota bacterium]MBU2457809.1 prepilin-type N-terminal cleavage/methylation domain-containing protein [Planctomycetota bacterium]
MKAVGKGVTLVELLIVVLIIGALTFITIPKLAMTVVNLGRSQTGAERMAAAIRHCRTLSISNASTSPQGFRLNMTGPPSGYTGFQIVNVQTGAVIESDTIAENVTCTGANDFVFGPLGNRTGDTDNLTVSGGGKTYVISVITSTGMVKCTLQ